jgi:hypothetical protein
MIEQTITKNGHERHETHDVNNDDTRFHGFCIVKRHFVPGCRLLKNLDNPESRGQVCHFHSVFDFKGTFSK